MNMKKLAAMTLTATLLLAACGDTDDDIMMDGENMGDHGEMDHGDMDHGNMDHSTDGSIPEGLEEAQDPTFAVGDTAMITNAHMEGMEGVEAEVVGAFATTVYTVSYTPTTGGDPVEDHKWVVHEEVEDVGQAPLEPGTEVILDADHMEGMDGATATIDSAEETTVYMVNYTDKVTGDEVTNHKWVTESELSTVE
ncbi:YdhK family protein [Chryseomicrobium palamuruense]|uniref:YdhK family protein n=1 Tax=Chryseomicrobium palamuruense TaxID=682973 RepID=A0ABV8UX02_9BACL